VCAYVVFMYVWAADNWNLNLKLLVYIYMIICPFVVWCMKR
jgi:hypothetical protein